MDNMEMKKLELEKMNQSFDKSAIQNSAPILKTDMEFVENNMSNSVE